MLISKNMIIVLHSYDKILLLKDEIKMTYKKIRGNR